MIESIYTLFYTVSLRRFYRQTMKIEHGTKREVVASFILTVSVILLVGVSAAAADHVIQSALQLVL